MYFFICALKSIIQKLDFMSEYCFEYMGTLYFTHEAREHFMVKFTKLQPPAPVFKCQRYILVYMLNAKIHLLTLCVCLKCQPVKVNIHHAGIVQLGHESYLCI